MQDIKKKLIKMQSIKRYYFNLFIINECQILFKD